MINPTLQTPEFLNPKNLEPYTISQASLGDCDLKDAG